MLKYIIFILVFNSFCFAQNNSEHKRVLTKRITQEKLGGVIETTDSEHNFHLNREGVDANIAKPLMTVNNKNANEAAANKTGSQITVHLDKNTIKQDDNKVVSNPTRKVDEEDNNLVWSGFYGFLGLSFVVIIYFLVRAFRLRPGAPPPTTVRKYGIVGRRSDMEMLPLPLEEEDDDTVFEMGRQGHIR